MKHRTKFLFFHENKRPAYHGTWRKKSSSVRGRRPFAQDVVSSRESDGNHFSFHFSSQKFFDYEVDSDDEWEEEEPGESLHDSDSEKDKEEEDDYEVDNDFFVPYGHLSDEEMDVEMVDNNHPDTQKAKLKILQQEFAAEMKKKTEKIKPRLIGCIWANGDEDENGCSNDKKYLCTDIIWRILKAREMMTSEDGVKLEENLEPELADPREDADKNPTQTKTPAQQKNQPRAKITNESVKELIKLVHGNQNNKKFIVREFQAYRLKNYHKDADCAEYSIKSIDDKMTEICDYKLCPDGGPMFGKKCWYVKPDVVKEFYGDDKPSLPNEWTYILEKDVKERKPKPAAEIAEKPTAEAEPKSEIVKPPTLAVKKRVPILMSVERGQAFSETKKSSLMSQFLSGSSSKTKEENSSGDNKMQVDDEIIEID